ncbi:MAG: response regulator [Desulfobacterales bacterium]|jgi:two-component system cell cycle response regulator
MTSKHQVLIVDDEPLNVKLFASILSVEGYDISSAFNGEEALEKVNEACPDLILLDIMMPGIDGFEVTRQLKNSYETRDIPIILITASDNADYKVIGHEAGADEFLNKPIKAPELKSRVKSLLHTKVYQDKLKIQKKTEADGLSNYKGNDTNQVVNDISPVLLVFENEEDAKSIELFLHGQPYQIMIGQTAEEAITLSNQRQIDLILLDGMHQGGKCFEICSHLKEREQTANTQILVVADSEFFDNHHEKFEVWSDDFLIKPINVHELRTRVKALLKKKAFWDKLYADPKGSVRAAITDSLTDLANDSYFKVFLEHEMKRSFRNNRPVTLLMIELTNVKHNPNCVGHLAGEQWLKDLGTFIKDNIRDVDLGARYKEKQFAIVLGDTDRNEARMVAERLRSLVENHFSKTSANSPAENSSVNIGIAEYPSDADSTEQLINGAVDALTESKKKYSAQFIKN